MSDRLFDIKKELKNGVDFGKLLHIFFLLSHTNFVNKLGGGRGYLTKNILAETVENVKVFDISETMLKQAEGTPGVNIEKHLLNDEYLHLEENSQDVVISNLTLHW